MVEILFFEVEFHYLFHFHFAFYFFVKIVFMSIWSWKQRKTSRYFVQVMKEKLSTR